MVKLLLLADDGTSITEGFNDSYEQTELERKFRTMREEEFLGKATVYLTFWSRMDTKKASLFLEEVAEKVGFKIDRNIIDTKRTTVRSKPRVGKNLKAILISNPISIFDGLRRP